MTIQNTTRLSIGTGNGATTTWPYNFLIPTTDDVVVSIYNADTNVKIEDVAPADYTITGVGDTNGGNVEYPLTGSPLASDRKIVILRVMDYHQDLDISNQGGFHADTLEAQLDRTTMQIQQLAEASERTITLPPTNDVDDAEALTQAILAVEDIETDITTVAGISGDVTTVAGISTEVTTVAGISDAIQNASGLLRGVDVRAASNSNISLASLTAGASAGGVTLAAGDDYGVFGNTDATENGIYTIQSSGAPVRHTSFDTWDEIAGGVFHVREGDLAGRQYLNLNATGGGTIDTNDLHFRPHSLDFDTVAALLADTALSYSNVSAGDRITAGGLPYEVAASGTAVFNRSTDPDGYHKITAGGVKLFVRPGDDGWVNALAFGLVNDGDMAGGGTNNYANLQLSIDYAEELEIPVWLTGGFRCDSGLVVDKSRMTWIGSGLATYIDFANLAAGEWAITFGVSAAPNASTFGNFSIYVNTTANGFRINGNGVPSSINVARCTFLPMGVFNVRWALRTTYTTTCHFGSFITNNCILGYDAATQSNELQFDRASFVNCEKFADFNNCEGIQFNSLHLQNITDAAAAYAMTMRQTAVTVINAYFENFSNADIALLGGSGDTIGNALIIMGGIAPAGKDIVYRENLNHVIDVSGIRVAGTGRIGITTAQSSGYWYLTNGVLTNTNDDVTTLQGEPLTIHTQSNLPYRGEWLNDGIVSGGLLFPGYVQFSGVTRDISTGITVDDPMTIVAAMRRDASGALTIRWRDGGSIVQTLSLSSICSLDSEDWELRYIPMYALGDQIQLIFSAHNFQLKYLGLFKGHVFPVPDIHKDPETLYINGTGGLNTGFSRGQLALNQNPSSGSTQGWMYDGSSWLPLANLA